MKIRVVPPICFFGSAMHNPLQSGIPLQSSHLPHPTVSSALWLTASITSGGRFWCLLGLRVIAVLIGSLLTFLYHRSLLRLGITVQTGGFGCDARQDAARAGFGDNIHAPELIGLQLNGDLSPGPGHD